MNPVRISFSLSHTHSLSRSYIHSYTYFSARAFPQPNICPYLSITCTYHERFVRRHAHRRWSACILLPIDTSYLVVSVSSSHRGLVIGVMKWEVLAVLVCIRSCVVSRFFPRHEVYLYPYVFLCLLHVFMSLYEVKLDLDSNAWQRVR